MRAHFPSTFSLSVSLSFPLDTYSVHTPYMESLIHRYLHSIPAAVGSESRCGVLDGPQRWSVVWALSNLAAGGADPSPHWALPSWVRNKTQPREKVRPSSIKSQLSTCNCSHLSQKRKRKPAPPPPSSGAGHIMPGISRPVASEPTLDFDYPRRLKIQSIAARAPFALAVLPCLCPPLDDWLTRRRTPPLPFLQRQRCMPTLY